MLVDLGVEYVILGHSERRGEHHELDETVREKAVAAMAAGLTPIVCVGENADQRAAGESEETVGWQIQGSLPQGFRGIVAYEPIWAIGSGTAASQQDIADMSRFIREELVRQFGEAGKNDPNPLWWVRQRTQCHRYPACRTRGRGAGGQCQPEGRNLRAACPRRPTVVIAARPAGINWKDA